MCCCSLIGRWRVWMSDSPQKLWVRAFNNVASREPLLAIKRRQGGRGGSLCVFVCVCVCVVGSEKRWEERKKGECLCSSRVERKSWGAWLSCQQTTQPCMPKLYPDPLRSGVPTPSRPDWRAPFSSLANVELALPLPGAASIVARSLDSVLARLG